MLNSNRFRCNQLTGIVLGQTGTGEVVGLIRNVRWASKLEVTATVRRVRFGSLADKPSRAFTFVCFGPKADKRWPSKPTRVDADFRRLRAAPVS
jgi:hypothetical protein